MTQPDTSSPAGTIDGAPPRDDVLTAGPDMHSPGQPPGGAGPTGPSQVRSKRRKSTTSSSSVPVPSRSANKPDLVDYVVAAHGVDRQTAEGMNKTQLAAYIPDSASEPEQGDGSGDQG